MVGAFGRWQQTPEQIFYFNSNDGLCAPGAADTNLCAPSNAGFRNWLSGVPKQRAGNCGAATPAAAYLTQAVPSRDHPVPLVAGDDVLLRITGWDADGGELFSLSFEMPEVADGNGSSSFVFALPVRAGWAGELASITLSGPGGSVRLDEETGR